MANYDLVIGSKFKPFSYAELIQPVHASTEAHMAVENEYADLTNKSSIWEGMANEQTDKIAYGMYKKYADDLKAKADMLATEGLNTASRQDMRNMQSRYMKEISPIEQAYTARAKQIEEQQTIRKTDPTRMFNRIAAESSLDDYLKNPTLSYENYSGAMLTAQVSQAASALANELSGYGKGKSVDQFTDTFLKRYGYTKNQVLDAINNPDRANSQPVLNSLVETVIGSSNIGSWGNADTLNRAYSYARQGLYSAIGKSDVTPMENKAAILAAQNPTPTPDIESGYLPANPLPIYSSKERAAYDADIKKFEKYFIRDKYGRPALSAEGWKEYNRTESYPVYYAPGYYNKDLKSYPSALRSFIDDKLKAGSFINGKSYQPGNIANKFIQYQDEYQKGRKDATRVTEWDTAISMKDRPMTKSSILTSLIGTDKVNIVDYNSKTKKFESVGTLSTKDLSSDNYEVANKRTSPYGNSFIVIDKAKGEAVRIEMPVSMNPTAIENLDSHTRAMEKIQKAIHTGKDFDPVTGTEVVLTPYQIEKLNNQYKILSDEKNTIESNIGQGGTSVDDTVYKRYAY